MNDLQEILIRHYVHSSASGKLFIGMNYDPRACRGGNDDGNDRDGNHVSARGHTPRHERGGDLDIIVAAGLSRHWGTRLLRLKWALDPAEYRPVLALFRDLAAEASIRLHWDDEELARFLAEDVLLGWLLDRQFQGRGEWKQRCHVLRNILNAEARKAAVAMQTALGV